MRQEDKSIIFKDIEMRPTAFERESFVPVCTSITFVCTLKSSEIQRVSVFTQPLHSKFSEFLRYRNGTIAIRKRIVCTHLYLSYFRICIRCTTLLPPFFSEIRGFIVKTGYTLMIQSIVHRWLLLSPIFRVAYESRVEKTGHLLRLSTNRSNFLFLHKTGSTGQPGRVPLIETSDSQRE